MVRTISTLWSYCARGGADGDVDSLSEAQGFKVERIMDSEAYTEAGAGLLAPADTLEEPFHGAVDTNEDALAQFVVVCAPSGHVLPD